MAPKRRRSAPRARAAGEKGGAGEDDGEVSFHVLPAAKRARLDRLQSDDGAGERPPPRRSPNGFLLPDPVPRGFRLVDNSGGVWRVGEPIGLGGFGEIYAASAEGVDSAEDYVVKVEPHANGPLFVEINFYLNAARKEQIESWREDRGLEHVGVTHFVASGSMTLNEKKFRFLVLPRLGTDLQSVVDAAKNKAFALKTAVSIASQVISSLEYIHSRGYIHKDVKGSNILFCRETQPSPGRPQRRRRQGKMGDRVVLVDFGLCSRYRPGGLHKPYSPDRRWAHEGTLEYTSRDCHLGCFSRRGDLEVTLYNLVEWLGGRLPWEDWQDVKPSVIQEAKINAFKNVSGFLSNCFGGVEDIPKFLIDMFDLVAATRFDEEPDYEGLRCIMDKEVRRVEALPKTISSEEDDEEITLSLQLRRTPSFASMPKESCQQPVTVSDEGKEANPRRGRKMKRRKVVRALRRLDKNKGKALPTVPEDDEKDEARHSSSEPSRFFDADDVQVLESSETKASAAAYKHARRESFKIRSQESMLNPTPEMLKQAAAMKRRAMDKTPAKLARRATPQKWKNLTPTNNTPVMEEVMQRREKRRRSDESEPQADRSPKVQARRKIKLGTKGNQPTSPTSPVRSAIASGRKKQLQQLQQMKRKQLLTRSRSVPVLQQQQASSSGAGAPLSYIVDAGMGLIRGISRNLFNGFAGRKVSG